MRVVKENKEAAVQKRTRQLAPKKLKLLVTVVDRKKTEFYADFIQSYEANMQTVFAATGTAKTEMMNLLGLSDNEKSVILSVIRNDNAEAVLSGLEEKFKTIKNGKGIAYTVPMTDTIGVAIYQFLANIKK